MKIKTLDELSRLTEKLKKKGKKIVLSHGVFDFLHAGHIYHLEEGKKHGDVLMVSITPDKFIKKGKGRPRFNENLRMKFLSALQCVDFVCTNDSPDSSDVIIALKPDVYLKGEDVKEKADNPKENLYKEIQLLKKHGGQVCFITSLPIHSTELLNKFFNKNN